MKLNPKMIIELKEENEKLKEILIKQHDIIEKATKCCDMLEKENKMLRAALNAPDIIFPNSEERGTGEQEQPINVSDIFES